MRTRAQLVAAIKTFRGRTAINPIDEDELADLLQRWLDYYNQTGAWNRAEVQSVLAQSVVMQNSLVARSLSLNATNFVDGVNGNNAGTSTANDSNAAIGRVKNLACVA